MCLYLLFHAGCEEHLIHINFIAFYCNATIAGSILYLLRNIDELRLIDYLFIYVYMQTFQLTFLHVTIHIWILLTI